MVATNRFFIAERAVGARPSLRAPAYRAALTGGKTRSLVPSFCASGSSS